MPPLFFPGLSSMGPPPLQVKINLNSISLSSMDVPHQHSAIQRTPVKNLNSISLSSMDVHQQHSSSIQRTPVKNLNSISLSSMDVPQHPHQHSSAIQRTPVKKNQGELSFAGKMNSLFYIYSKSVLFLVFKWNLYWVINVSNRLLNHFYFERIEISAITKMYPCCIQVR